MSKKQQETESNIPRYDSITEDFLARAESFLLENPEVVREVQDAFITAGRAMRLKRERLAREQEMTLAAVSPPMPESHEVEEELGPPATIICYQYSDTQLGGEHIEHIHAGHPIFALKGVDNPQLCLYYSHFFLEMPDERYMVIIASLTDYRVGYGDSLDTIHQKVRVTALEYIKSGGEK